MTRLTYLLDDVKIVIMETTVICEDSTLKKLFEDLIKMPNENGTQDGFFPIFHEIFGNDIKLVLVEEDDLDIVY
jgi:hypothetical protein